MSIDDEEDSSESEYEDDTILRESTVFIYKGQEGRWRIGLY